MEFPSGQFSRQPSLHDLPPSRAEHRVKSYPAGSVVIDTVPSYCSLWSLKLIHLHSNCCERRGRKTVRFLYT